MARSAIRLYEAKEPGEDMRMPIALSLVGFYGDDMSAEDLVVLVEALLPIEAAELDPRVAARTGTVGG